MPPPLRQTHSQAARALYVEPAKDNGALRIFARPFHEKTPAKGYYEFTFRIIEGTLNFNLELFTAPWDPEGTWYRAGGEHPFGFILSPGQTVLFGKQQLKTDGVGKLATDENYTFRIEWKPAGDALEFQFLLNGQPLSTENGTPFTTRVPQSKIGNGVMGFRLSSGSADGPCVKGFIGGIQAEPIES